MMHMSLYWGKDVILLFDSWRTDSWPAYAAALILCFLFSALHQFLASRRIRLRSSDPDLSSLTANTPLIARKIRRNRRVASAGLFGISSAMGYLIMLAVMSYNGGVLVAVVLGITLGYYLFRSGDNGEEEDESVSAENNTTCACS